MYKNTKMYNNIIGCFARDLGFKTLGENQPGKEWNILFQAKESTYMKAHEKKRPVLIITKLKKKKSKLKKKKQIGNPVTVITL